MAVPVDALNRVLVEAAAPPDWIIAITDRQGMTIARSHSPEQFVGTPIKADIAERVAASLEGVFANITRDGVPVYNAFTRSAIADWRIVVGVPRATVNAPLRHALWSLGGIALVVLVLGAGGALAFGRRIVQPVTSMVEAARALGAGNPTVSVPRSEVAEINELAQALDQAAVLVREREEAQRQLRAALTDADRMKDEFLAALSHELRTPMTAILGWSRMMETRTLDEPTVRKAVASIRRNAELQAHLIEDVLDVSRIITGNIALTRWPCDPPVIVRECVEEFLPVAGDKGIALELAVDDSVGPLVADAARLRQIVSNLLSNALKFTPRDGRIDVRLDETDGALRIVVRDTGIGIAREFLPHVFDRFRQADGSSTRAYGGLGLGLSIVRDLVSLHGGEVTAESGGPGRGTTMTVRLPITRPGPDASVARTITPALDGDLHGLRILIVEDDPDAREFLAELLRRRGVHVTETISVGDALAALRGGQYDIVISDIGLPGRDGYALIQDLRAGGSHVPVIAITAYARPQDRERALAAGFRRHIAKPFRPTEVLRAVVEVSQKRDASA
jgi:signal transduction histidine kinase